ncbi:MAG: hypothetical protein H8E26_07445 [FCB group bacterium]|nr:hypothetical protein [FCB group bacterium]MBL7029076.1 hypothetical protein [Candidatus Neomarinimicrobiota bacterium]MBL7122556.1 hypothetical protein [Candidatus Neomarinimicrobiota bacterium]
MIRYVIISISGGILFGVLDAVLNANPLAQKLYAVYKPIMRARISPALGTVIDLAYGFILAGIFLLLVQSLPGDTGFLKGLSYGLLIWFFRVVMYGATQYVMFNISFSLLLYIIVSGLLEMMIIGVFFGITLKP